jgi:hypothetical protein
MLMQKITEKTGVIAGHAAGAVAAADHAMTALRPPAVSIFSACTIPVRTVIRERIA